MQPTSQLRAGAADHQPSVCNVAETAEPDMLPDGPGRAGPRSCDRGLPRSPAMSTHPHPVRRVWFASILRAPRHLSNGTALSRACGLDCAPPLGGVSTTPGALARVRVVVSRSVIT